MFFKPNILTIKSFFRIPVKILLHSRSSGSFFLTHITCMCILHIKRWFFFQIHLYNSLPLKALSQWIGDLSKREIPKWARRPIYGTYCQIYEVNLNEAIESDLTKYSNLNEFFRRKLKPECRPIDEETDLIAPCDAKVLHCGVITDENQVEQVKGMTYSLNEFLGGSFNKLPFKEEVLCVYASFKSDSYFFLLKYN